MKCNRGHEHSTWDGPRHCTTEDCKVCDYDDTTGDGKTCDIVDLLEAAAAPCQRALGAIDSAHLSGFTTRAASALVHLREAWCNADDSNRPGIERAITALFTTRSLGEEPQLYTPYLRHGLADALADRLIAAVLPIARKKSGRK